MGAMHAPTLEGRSSSGGLWLAACLLATAAAAQTGGSEGLSPTLANIKNDACGAARLSREFAAVLVPRPGQPADRLQPRTLRGRRRRNRRRGRRSRSQDRLRQGHVGRPHSGGDAEQDRPRMRVDHGERRARQAGGVLAADVRGRHQADGAEGLERLGRRPT